MAQRLEAPPTSTFNDAQRQVVEAITSGPRGMVAGPLEVWLHSPGLADRAQMLGAYCRYESSLAPALRELAILLVAAHWRAGYEWHAHAPLARSAGLSENTIQAIRSGIRPKLHSGELVVYEFCLQILQSGGVSQPTYDACASELGNVGVVDLVGTLGYYTLIAMTVRAFNVAVPGGADDPFPNSAST